MILAIYFSVETDKAVKKLVPVLKKKAYVEKILREVG
jgi:hypothetical protein